MRYKQKRFYEWSPEIAYSVGLMASDGCLSKDGRHLDLTSVDIEQLENFSKAIGRELRISSNGSIPIGKKWSQGYRLQFSDVAYYDFLWEIGLRPSKSKTISKLAIHDEYWIDFIRGVFDGDGSFYGYNDRRWKSSFMFYLTFTSASLDFLQFIQSKNIDLLQLGSGSLRPGKRAYILSYAKTDTIKLAACMYHDIQQPHLSRKRLKYEAFINRNNSGIIATNARVAKLVDALA